MNMSALSKYVVAALVAGIVAGSVLVPMMVSADNQAQNTVLVKNDHLTKCPIRKDDYNVAKTVKMLITAYSSEPDQTDDTPFITASGAHVADGIIANNLLPFGTKVKMPELYGDKVFVVQDRMNTKAGKLHADIWMADTGEAINFGAKVTSLQILQD